MTHLSRISLLALFIASVLLTPFALGEDNWVKHNRKLAKLEEKRVKKINKLQTDHQKFLSKQNKIDGKKLRKHELEIKKKVKKINDDYLKDVQKLERKRNQRITRNHGKHGPAASSPCLPGFLRAFRI